MIIKMLRTVRRKKDYVEKGTELEANVTKHESGARYAETIDGKYFHGYEFEIIKND